MKKIFILVALGICSVAMANRESGGRGSASAIYVDFRSFGSGIDYLTKNEVIRLIGEARMNGNVLEQTSEVRGREGESLECVQLVDAYKRYQFIKSIAPSILADTHRHGDQRTVVYVGLDCRDLSAATEQDLSKYSN